MAYPKDHYQGADTYGFTVRETVWRVLVDGYASPVAVVKTNKRAQIIANECADSFVLSPNNPTKTVRIMRTVRERMERRSLCRLHSNGPTIIEEREIWSKTVGRSSENTDPEAIKALAASGRMIMNGIV